MIREKYNLIQELQRKNEELKGNKKLSLVGQGDFPGGNNVMRAAMNIKHHSQHLAIDDPEFPFLYDGKENVSGENSSYFMEAKKNYEVIAICKKYDEMLKGKSYNALYFLHSPDDDSYKLVERKEIENLTENFGFEYNNDYIDSLEIGEKISKGTVIQKTNSYDATNNTGIGVNGRIVYAVHPAVQDDAIVISESFAKRLVTNNVIKVSIPINEDTILLNLYGKDGKYQGLPNIGDHVTNGIIAATRTIKESKMFSDMRDASLTNINFQADHPFYGNGEIVDIDVFCNNKNLKKNAVNEQLIRYWNDCKWFYTQVYKTCKSIIKSGSQNIDREIHRWMRLAMNYLDQDELWAFNDDIVSNLLVELTIRTKEPIKVGRKIVGRHGTTISVHVKIG